MKKTNMSLIFYNIENLENNYKRYQTLREI